MTFIRDLRHRLHSRPAANDLQDELGSPDGQELSTSCSAVGFQLGTGASIYTNVLIPALLSARSEIILVTCFWAPSTTLEALSDALRKLAAYRRDAALASSQAPSTLSIKICFSSRSFFQKLFHTSSRAGFNYPSCEWTTKLGLPDAATLAAGGIEMQVKTLFFLPFSVMHPKFLIVDRERAFLPSCNVSWEAWLESCVEVRGEILAGLVAFYARTWDWTLDTNATFSLPTEEGGPTPTRTDALGSDLKQVSSPAHQIVSFPPFSPPVPTLLLPSSHHRNPRFRPFPWQSDPALPLTPLNVALLQLFDTATTCIYIQTPDLTCAAVTLALLDALERGVDVTIVTNRNVKLSEQILTAGTSTVRCVESFVWEYRRRRASPEGDGSMSRFGSASSRWSWFSRWRDWWRYRRGGHRRLALGSGRDLEAQNAPRMGDLQVSYFKPRAPAGHPASTAEEPVHTHAKVTIVDRQHAVLGSGNMDRASWYTSQELGVMFSNDSFAVAVEAALAGVLEGRLDVVFDSTVLDV
jgi:phosphatidylserine/phosphatidylglycerophosphate/cardiolipin synthase-like enzyme